MKESFWIYGLFLLGLFIITAMMLVENHTSRSEADYYLTKEVLEASMIDAIDYGLYMETGEIRMIQSKFVEVFTRRFAESVKANKDYTLDFYEIYETPPKATVLVRTSTGEYTISGDTTDFDVVTTLSGILESKSVTDDDYLTE